MRLCLNILRPSHLGLFGVPLAISQSRPPEKNVNFDLKENVFLDTIEGSVVCAKDAALSSPKVHIKCKLGTEAEFVDLTLTNAKVYWTSDGQLAAQLAAHMFANRPMRAFWASPQSLVLGLELKCCFRIVSDTSTVNIGNTRKRRSVAFRPLAGRRRPDEVCSC